MVIIIMTTVMIFYIDDKGNSFDNDYAKLWCTTVWNNDNDNEDESNIDLK